jgi:hypothetical protein
VTDCIGDDIGFDFVLMSLQNEGEMYEYLNFIND